MWIKYYKNDFMRFTDIVKLAIVTVKQVMMDFKKITKFCLTSWFIKKIIFQFSFASADLRLALLESPVVP